jgi:hypothetical protein
MKSRFTTFTILAALVLSCAASVAFAQDSPYPNPIGVYTVGPHHDGPSVSPSGKQLVQWNGSFTDLTHNKINFTMVGTDPSKTNVTSTTTVWIIPIKFVFDANHGNKTFDPNKVKVSNGKTVTQNTMASPLFQSGVDFKNAKIDLGDTQYIDAFQRGNWWGKNVKKNSKYHVLMKAVLKPEQTINCNNSSCAVGNEFGVQVGLEDINAYDATVNGFMTKLKATPDVLPFFIFYDVYLTSGGCCIGGYHNANGAQPGGQTYSNAAYVDKVGAFSQDVSAMSHELGEWMDDPFIDNRVNCQDNSILEVGDPLEGMSNFGGFPYKLHGFTYNLQSLVYIGYFGAPRSDSANKWLAFQNDETHVCPGQ